MLRRINLSSPEAFFGADRALDIVQDCRDLAVQRPLLVGTRSTGKRHGRFLNAISALDAVHFFEAEPHSPAATIERATACFRQAHCDGVITLGGGSSTSIGKALAVSDSAPFIALPTTYSGSEVTAIYGRRVDGEKRTAIDQRCRPKRIIYDPHLSVDLPFATSFATATNSMAHAIDALYAADAGALTALLAREVLEIYRDELPRLAQDTGHAQIRERLLYAGFLGGLLVSMHGIALHHQLCHVIGGLYGTPHGDNNAAVLPQAIAYNAGIVPRADEVLTEVYGATHGAGAVYDFIARYAPEAGLTAFDLPDDAAEHIVAQQCAHGGYNPRPLDRDALLPIVQAALCGTRPNHNPGPA